MSKEFNTAVDRCLDMLEQGVSIRDCLDSFPQHASKLRPLLTAAGRVRGVEAPPPSPRAFARGEEVLVQTIQQEAARPKRRFLPWPLAPVAAAATLATLAIIVLVIGGHVRDALDFGTDAADAHGTITAVGPDTLEIETGDGLATVLIDRDTEIQDPDGSRLDIRVISPGAEVRVRGETGDDGSIIADRIEVRVRLRDNVPGEMEFEGQVATMGDGTIAVTTPAGNIMVAIRLDTEVDGQILPGVLVKVHGAQQADGSVLAREIDVLALDAMMEDEEEDKRGHIENDDRDHEDDRSDNSGPGSSSSGPGSGQ